MPGQFTQIVNEELDNYEKSELSSFEAKDKRSSEDYIRLIIRFRVIRFKIEEIERFLPISPEDQIKVRELKEKSDAVLRCFTEYRADLLMRVTLSNPSEPSLK